MALHATLVAFLNGKGQGVVARVLVVLARKCTIPRFNGRGIDNGTTCTRLQIHGIDTILLQAVQDVAKFLLLLFASFLGHCPCLWPVKSHYGGKPYGTHLVFGHGTNGHTPNNHKQCENIFHVRKGMKKSCIFVNRNTQKSQEPALMLIFKTN